MSNGGTASASSFFVGTFTVPPSTADTLRQSAHLSWAQHHQPTSSHQLPSCCCAAQSSLTICWSSLPRCPHWCSVVKTKFTFFPYLQFLPVAVASLTYCPTCHWDTNLPTQPIHPRLPMFPQKPFLAVSHFSPTWVSYQNHLGSSEKDHIDHASLDPFKSGLRHQ